MPADRQQLRRSLYRLASSQAGYFTAAQALKIGYSYQAQKYHVDYGNWDLGRRRRAVAFDRVPSRLATVEGWSLGSWSLTVH